MQKVLSYINTLNGFKILNSNFRINVCVYPWASKAHMQILHLTETSEEGP